MDTNALLYAVLVAVAPIALERLDTLIRRFFAGRDVQALSGEFVGSAFDWTAEAIRETRQMAADGVIDEDEAGQISDEVLGIGTRLLAKKLGK